MSFATGKIVISPREGSSGGKIPKGTRFRMFGTLPSSDGEKVKKDHQGDEYKTTRSVECPSASPIRVDVTACQEGHSRQLGEGDRLAFHTPIPGILADVVVGIGGILCSDKAPEPVGLEIGTTVSVRAMLEAGTRPSKVRAEIMDIRANGNLDLKMLTGPKIGGPLNDIPPGEEGRSKTPFFCEISAATAEV